MFVIIFYNMFYATTFVSCFIIFVIQGPVTLNIMLVILVLVCFSNIFIKVSLFIFNRRSLIIRVLFFISLSPLFIIEFNLCLLFFLFNGCMLFLIHPLY